MVRSSRCVECVGQRAAEGRASNCWGVGEQGWRVDDLLSYFTLLGRGEVHGVRARRRWVAWGEREIVGVWVCGEVERACPVCGAEGGGRLSCVVLLGAWASRGGVWTICCLTSYSVVARSTRG